MALAGLIKMKCCVVAVTGAATLIILLAGTNIVNAGISGTIALIYTIALFMLVGIALHEKCCARKARRATPRAD